MWAESGLTALQQSNRGDTGRADTRSTRGDLSACAAAIMPIRPSVSASTISCRPARQEMRLTHLTLIGSGCEMDCCLDRPFSPSATR
jgi:hypothetical protein